MIVELLAGTEGHPITTVKPVMKCGEGMTLTAHLRGAFLGEPRRVDDGGVGFVRSTHAVPMERVVMRANVFLGRTVTPCTGDA